MIIESDIKGWDNKIVNNNKVIYPQTLDNESPCNFFLSIFCGSRGTGKSYLITKLLKTLEEKKFYLDGKIIPQRIILISTTAHSDSNKIFKTLNNLDWEIDVIDDDFETNLKNKINEVKNDLDESKEYKEYKKTWLKFKKMNINKLNKLNVDELEEFKILDKYNFCDIEDIPEPKYIDGFVLHWFIDDLLGTEMFKNGKSIFTNLCIRNRHVIPGNILITTQSIMSIPKTIRLNSNLIVLFKFANKEAILEDIYPIISAYITEEEFKELYEYATKEPHDALVIDFTSSKLKFKKNFNILLNLNNSGH